MSFLKRLARSALATLLWLIVLASIAATVVPRFLDRIYYRGPASSHYDGRRFFNPDGDDALSLGTRTPPYRLMLQQLFGAPERPAWPSRVAVTQTRPPARVAGQAMLATWIGHATVLIQTQGLNILTDPIWNETAGPLGIGPRRVAEPGVRFEDLPRIDLVLVSHDHYDHLDLPTLRRLWRRDRPLVVTSLGNDSVIRQAGVPSRALDWGQRLAVRPGVEVAVTRNHHWGSRWFSDRDRALWSSFVVRLPGGNVFFAGDTGPGDLKWPGEARALGPIRFAAIPIGAFRFEPSQMVSGSHVGPRDAIRVWNGLGRPWSMPIHWGTFRLSWEAYDTPPRMLEAMLKCGASDPAAFAARPLGRSFEVPALVAQHAPVPQDEGIEACARRGAFDAFR